MNTLVLCFKWKFSTFSALGSLLWQIGITQFSFSIDFFFTALTLLPPLPPYALVLWILTTGGPIPKDTWAMPWISDCSGAASNHPSLSSSSAASLCSVPPLIPSSFAKAKMHFILVAGKGRVWCIFKTLQIGL